MLQKHSTKNSYQTMFITIPHFVLATKYPKSKMAEGRGDVLGENRVLQLRCQTTDQKTNYYCLNTVKFEIII